MKRKTALKVHSMNRQRLGSLDSVWPQMEISSRLVIRTRGSLYKVLITIKNNERWEALLKCQQYGNHLVNNNACISCIFHWETIMDANCEMQHVIESEHSTNGQLLELP